MENETNANSKEEPPANHENTDKTETATPSNPYPPAGYTQPVGGPPQAPMGYPPNAAPPYAVTTPPAGTPYPQPPGGPGPAGYPQPQGGFSPAGYPPPPGGFSPAGYPPGPPAANAIQWMPAPEAPAGCPPGLEYLSQLDQILVHQQVELLEAMTGIQTANRYQVKNSLGQQMFFAQEEIQSQLSAQFFGSGRGFLIHVTNNLQQEVIRVERPFKCCAGCCWCADSDACGFTVTVTTAAGEPLGFVRQRTSLIAPHFDVLDVNQTPVLKLRGPTCMCQDMCCTGDIEFQLKTADDVDQVGAISKQWGGYAKESFTTADNFGITFPKDLDVSVKATLLGALFLIDFMYFEVDPNANRNN